MSRGHAGGEEIRQDRDAHPEQQDDLDDQDAQDDQHDQHDRHDRRLLMLLRGERSVRPALDEGDVDAREKPLGAAVPQGVGEYIFVRR